MLMSQQPGHKAIGTSGQTLLLIRWTLIIATAYLILYRNPVRIISPMVGLFLAGYLGSNLLVAVLLRRIRPQTLNMAIALVDAILVSAALVLTQANPANLIILYFVVMLIATLPESLALVTAAAGLIAGGQLCVIYRTGKLSLWPFLASGAQFQIPFLFVVALFFGHLVERVRTSGGNDPSPG
jgi:hypothetical protein